MIKYFKQLDEEAMPVKSVVILLNHELLTDTERGQSPESVRKTSKPEAYTRRTSQCFYKC